MACNIVGLVCTQTYSLISLCIAISSWVRLMFVQDVLSAECYCSLEYMTWHMCLLWHPKSKIEPFTLDKFIYVVWIWFFFFELGDIVRMLTLTGIVWTWAMSSGGQGSTHISYPRPFPHCSLTSSPSPADHAFTACARRGSTCGIKLQLAYTPKAYPISIRCSTRIATC